MRFIFLLVTLLIFSGIDAQRIIKYFNYKWQETTPNYGAYIGIWKKQDSIWEKKDYYAISQKMQMAGHYTDTTEKVPMGTFYFFYPNGNLERTMTYKNGKLQGERISYYENGVMQDSTFYENGEEIGISLSWHQNSFIEDSTSQLNDSLKLYIAWFDNGLVSAAGRYLKDKKHGTWTYYSREGNKTAIEKYLNGVIISKTYYSQNGEAIDTLKAKDRIAEFPGGVQKWTKYLTDNLYSPPNVKLVNSDKIVVVVEFEINEDGKVVNARVKTPFHDEYDKIALQVVNNSPKWKPAFQKNRNVKHRCVQAVFFQESE